MKTIDKLKMRFLKNPKIKMIAFNFPTGTGNICSLSEILEENPDPKYFLSEKLMKGLMSGSPAFQGRFKPKNGEEIADTLTARYHKMGKTDTYIKSSK